MPWFGLEFERPKGRARKLPQPQLIPDAEVISTESLERAKESGSLGASVEANPTAEAIPSQVNSPLKFALRHLDPDPPNLSGRGFAKETIAHFVRDIILTRVSFDAVQATLAGIALRHMLRTGQLVREGGAEGLTPVEQGYALAASLPRWQGGTPPS